MDNWNNSTNLAENQIEMPKKYPPLDKSKLVLNPFSQELVIPATKIVEVGKFVRDEDGTMIPSSFVADKSKCTRVYHSSTFRDMAMRLSPAALKLFNWIIYDIEAGEDFIRVMPEFYAKHGGKGASKTQYKVGVDELITAGYITPTVYKYTYWVNPIILYPGNRQDKWPDKVVVKNEWNPGKKSTVDASDVEEQIKNKK